jgi:hypothetical protein
VSNIPRFAAGIFFIRIERRLKVVLLRQNKAKDYCGAYRLPVRKKCEEGENFFSAFIKGSNEVLGEDFTTVCLGKAEFKATFRSSCDNKEVLFYSMFISEEYLKLINLEKDGGRIELVEIYKFFDGSITEILLTEKEKVYSRQMIAMFPDEIIAVKNILEQQT